MDSYKITYHPLVFEEDLKKIPQGDQRKILSAIFKKLSKDPYAYGKPLQKELKGYFRLRIMDYRAIYRIEKREIIVEVVKIGIRKDLIVYLQAAKRLKNL
ncbi:MAG: type II toxin-antitoxin system RelE/ParE family toxin [Candidatus Gracilibacteria bacterium]|jgi:mRNA interferase RelE/StbE